MIAAASNNQQGVSGLSQGAVGLHQNMQAEGGLGGLLSKFNQAGLGDQVASWVGTGQNLPVSADQLGQVLGGAGGLGALLDMDGNGNPLDDLMRLAGKALR